MSEPYNAFSFNSSGLGEIFYPAPLPQELSKYCLCFLLFKPQNSSLDSEKTEADPQLESVESPCKGPQVAWPILEAVKPWFDRPKPGDCEAVRVTLLLIFPLPFLHFHNALFPYVVRGHPEIVI